MLIFVFEKSPHANLLQDKTKPQINLDYFLSV